MKIYSVLKFFTLVLGFFVITSCSVVNPLHHGTNTTTRHFSWNNIFHPSWRYNLWPAMSENFALISKKNLQHAQVNKFIQHYQHNPNTITTLTANAKPYIYYIYHQTRQRHMPAELSLLPIVESNYNPFLFSKRGAIGLWQIMPGTASGFSLTINWWYDGRRDIVASTKAALDYLNYLHEFFGDWLLAAAAYDAGEGTVQAAIRHNKHINRPTDFWSLPLPAETKYYVPKMLALAEVIAHPSQYHVTLTKIPDQPYFKAIPMKGQINLKIIAKLATTSLTAIRQLNPAFRRWATAPDMNFDLLIPATKAAAFQKNLSNYKNKRVTWVRHKVVAGESLMLLAKRFDTKATIIKQVNSLPSNLIRINETLLIPQTNDIHFKMPRLRTNSSINEDHIPGPKHIEHHIVKNDTLRSISHRYNVTPRQIRFWNGISARHTLQVGDHLTIWKKPSYSHHKPVHYQVKPGDSLGVIAHRFHSSIKILQDANQLTSTQIKIGQRIIIPPNHVAISHYHPHFHNQMIMHPVQAGETLSHIAHEYGVSLTQIASWNHLDTHKAIQINQLIRIYHSQ